MDKERLERYGRWLRIHTERLIRDAFKRGERIPAYLEGDGELGAFRRGGNLFMKLFVEYSPGANSEWGKDWGSMRDFPDILAENQMGFFLNRIDFHAWNWGDDTPLGKSPDPEKHKGYCRLRDKFLKYFPATEEHRYHPEASVA